MPLDLVQNFEKLSTANDLSLLPNPKQEKILLRLQYFVKQVLDDPVFRRALRYRPAEALATHSFDATLAPESLGVKHYTIDILINHAQLFGLFAPKSISEPGLELRLVLYGVKPAALLHGDEKTLTNALHWSTQHGLTAILSPDQWQHVNDEGKGGYSNLTGSRHRAEAGSNAERSLVVAQDANHAMLTWLCLVFGWDEFLGNLLGYPKCCSQAFKERWPIAAQKHQGDPTILSLFASGSMPFNWRVNIAARYFGVELIQHFPCKFDCQHSIDLAKRYFETLSYFEPETAETLQYFLQSAVLYTEYDGIVLFNQVSVKKTNQCFAIQYTAASYSMTQADSKLAFAIQKNTQFDYDESTHRLMINDQHYPNAYLMLFCD